MRCSPSSRRSSRRARKRESTQGPSTSVASHATATTRSSRPRSATSCWRRRCAGTTSSSCLYSAKVYTAEQAQMVLDAMRMVSEKDERDLASVIVDETIFDDAHRAPRSRSSPLEVEGDGEITVNLAIAGTTYPFHKILKQAGFGGLHTKGGSPRHNLQRCARMHRSDSGDPESYRVYGFVLPLSGVTRVRSTYGKLFQNLSLHMHTNYFPK